MAEHQRDRQLERLAGPERAALRDAVCGVDGAGRCGLGRIGLWRGLEASALSHIAGLQRLGGMRISSHGTGSLHDRERIG